MSRLASHLVLSAVVVTALAAIACGTSDPRLQVLKERSRWTVTPKNVIEGEDGAIHLSVGVSGPARSKLERLTFLVRLEDAEGRAIGEEWKSVDLTQVPMGTGRDFSFRLDSADVAFDELTVTVDPVLAPSAEQEPYIAELQLN